MEYGWPGYLFAPSFSQRDSLYAAAGQPTNANVKSINFRCRFDLPIKRPTSLFFLTDHHKMQSGFPALLLLLALSVLAVVEARPRHLDNTGIETRADGEGEMQDALKYLEELDKYYSQVARPRYRLRSFPE